MKLYSEHLDYLMVAILYLGTSDQWWSRTPSKLADELSLDKRKLAAAFESFPGIFRRSKERKPPAGEYAYSLQARYAGSPEDIEDGKAPKPPPLPEPTIRLLYDFIQRAADDERTRRQARWGNGIAVTAAVISALAAIAVAIL